jgi:hypothetical protein
MYPYKIQAQMKILVASRSEGKETDKKHLDVYTRLFAYR